MRRIVICACCGVEFCPLYRADKRFCTRKCLRKQEYAKHKNKIIARVELWTQANKDKKIAYLKQYQLTNKDKVARWKRRWEIKNPAYLCAKTAKYMARKKQACPLWLTSADFFAIEQFYIIAKEFSKTGVPHHVDHTVPLQGKNVCGLHVPWNLQVIPAVDNIRKSNKYE